jgi:periplasmic protein CpxP/Spy
MSNNKKLNNLKMKNFAVILMMVIAVTFTANAQQKTAQKNRQNRPQFTAEQQTELVVKRMTLALDLNEKQQNQIKPLLLTQTAQRKTAMEKMKKARENKQKPSKEELFTMRSQQLDHQIAMKKAMKEILTKEQFEEFEKMGKTKGKKMLEKEKKK